MLERHIAMPAEIASQSGFVLCGLDASLGWFETAEEAQPAFDRAMARCLRAYEARSEPELTLEQWVLRSEFPGAIFKIVEVRITDESAEVIGRGQK